MTRQFQIGCDIDGTFTDVEAIAISVYGEVLDGSGGVDSRPGVDLVEWADPDTGSLLRVDVLVTEE